MTPISKHDVARRQILAAINLHWFLQDPLITYQLAANSIEICHSLLEHAGKDSIISFIADDNKTNDGNIFKYYINDLRNFVKHADRSPYETINNPTRRVVDDVLLTACFAYFQLSQRSPHIFGMFVLWYMSVYRPYPDDDALVELGTYIFGDLSSVSHAEQISAARRNSDFQINTLLNSHKNELTDNWRWSDVRKLGDKLRLTSDFE